MHSNILNVGYIPYPTMKLFFTNIHFSIKKADEILVTLAGTIINTGGSSLANHRQNTYSNKPMLKL